MFIEFHDIENRRVFVDVVIPDDVDEDAPIPKRITCTNPRRCPICCKEARDTELN